MQYTVVPIAFQLFSSYHEVVMGTQMG